MKTELRDLIEFQIRKDLVKPKNRVPRHIIEARQPNKVGVNHLTFAVNDEVKRRNSDETGTIISVMNNGRYVVRFGNKPVELGQYDIMKVES
jgi:hypothetical protein